MRHILFSILTLGLLWGAFPASAATGKVQKVLPMFLDAKGRDSVSPSLFDRDAYQAYLRQHPDKRSGMRFAVEWKVKGPAWEPLRLKLELRGVAVGNLPKEYSTYTVVERRGWLKPFTSVVVSGPEYKELGEVTAWRVTLWEGTQLLAEEKSFLW